MQENSKLTLSNREKGEHLKEIFESLNKSKKRLERLKSTRNLSVSEEKELQEVILRLKSFYEKCKMFIKFRKNGPGKFVVEEYLKWCNFQKPYHPYNTNQYKSSLEYVKCESEASQGSFQKSSASYSNIPQPPYPIRSVQTSEMDHSNSEDVIRANHYRNQMSPQQHLYFNQSAPDHNKDFDLKNRYLGPKVNETMNYGGYPKAFEREKSSPESLRKSIGHIEPLNTPKECYIQSPRFAPPPQNMSAGSYFKTSPFNFHSGMPGMGAMPIPIKTVAKRSNYSQNRQESHQDSEMPKKHDAQSFHPHQPNNHYGFPPQDRSLFVNKNHSHLMNHDPLKTSHYERTPVQSSHIHNMHPGAPNIAFPDQQSPKMFHSNFYNANPGFRHHPQVSSPRQLPIFKANHASMKVLSTPNDLQYDKTPTCNANSSSELNCAIDPNLKIGLPEMNFHVNNAHPQMARTTPNSFQTQFPFEFKFDNKEPEQGKRVDGPTFPRDFSLSKHRTSHTSFKPGDPRPEPKSNFLAKPDNKIKPEILNASRQHIDEFLQKIDPEINLSDKIKNCILVHVDSVMHKVMMFSASIASNRNSKKLTKGDFRLAFEKIVSPKFSDFEENESLANFDRDYTAYNKILGLINDQE